MVWTMHAKCNSNQMIIALEIRAQGFNGCISAFCDSIQLVVNCNARIIDCQHTR